MTFIKRVLLYVCALTTATTFPAVAGKLFISNERDNTVTVVDSKTFELLNTIETGRRPRGLITSPDGKFIYVCVGDDDAIDVVDVETMKVIRQLEPGPDPELLDVDPTGKRIYIATRTMPW
ncbi:YVTN family beta-propeller repeat protein [Enterovibrio coralii]|uniref:YVTN family beta-propeller repeat protein n=1 Tax=Enterovibrio coralii TaxID=294935 RepID=UPI000A727CE8|nr:hypothetical protein [Enterovibrio coralii]